MSSKRFKKLPKNTNTIKAEPINNLLSKVKGNCTTKFDESLDINILINNKQKKNEINLRSMVNLPSGTGKKIKIAVVCEESKFKEAKDSGADLVGGDDLISELVVLFVVELLDDPEAYSLVVVDVYPPSIAVFEPEVLVWVEPAWANVADIKATQRTPKKMYAVIFINIISIHCPPSSILSLVPFVF